MNLVPVGVGAHLAEVDDAAQALHLALYARRVGVAALEIVPGACTVLFDGVGDLSALRRALAAWTPSTTPTAGELVELPTTYDGADLDEVAAWWGTDRAGVVERHSDTTFTSSFCGFAPGFAYLAGLGPELAVPRLVSPRARVPAGSVALAGEWCGVYPTASPGGWRLIGHTDVRLWDAARPVPALLAPGTRVRFVARG